MTREEVSRHIGQRVTLRLNPQAPGGPTVTGRIEGVLDSIDGMLVTMIPDATPAQVRTIHYHYIEAITPAS